MHFSTLVNYFVWDCGLFDLYENILQSFTPKVQLDVRTSINLLKIQYFQMVT